MAFEANEDGSYVRQEIRITGSAALIAVLALIHCSGELPTGEQGRARPEAGELAAGVREALGAGTQLDIAAKLVPLLAQLDQENVSEVQAVYDEYMAALSESELQLFIDAWTRFDGLGALEYAMNIPFQYQAGIARRAAVQGWAARDPLAAKWSVSQLLESRPRIAKDLPTALVAGWVLAPQGGVQDFLLSVPKRSELIGSAIGVVYRRSGPKGALQWAEDLIGRDEDGDRRWLTFRQAVRQVGLRAPEVVAPFVLEHYGKDEYAKDGPRILTEAWLRKDPIRAFEWLRTEAPPESRAEAVGMAFTTWQYRDRTEAMRWLEARPQDPFYYPAFESGARRMAKNDPERGIALCGRIPAGDLHSQCLGSVAREWYRRDPAAAGAWMETSSLNAETRKAIREHGSRRRLGRSERARRSSDAKKVKESEETFRRRGPDDELPES